MPAPDLILCTRQDVIDVFGNNLTMLRELVGGSGTTFDQTTLDKPILVASGEIDAAAGNKFSVGYNADPTTYGQNVRNKTAVRAAYWFWIFNAQGKAMPPELKAVVDEITQDLQRVEDGKKGLGQNKAPGSRITSYGPTDITHGGTCNRMTVAGFQRW